MMEFLNNSLLGSPFTHYKLWPTSTSNSRPHSRRSSYESFGLGHEAARELGVPLPVAAAAHQVVQALIGHGYTDGDFAALIELQAKASGLELKPEAGR
ncbi:MAG: hypothetical protein JOY56_06610 [Solirubrobacterales bacterium]|nr:hypothetical protein [Solirubrobacterales bacterium]MBV9336881.1 hypothetical protein [Solirubrobacterales bacterium]MBV9942564.1 hypothetical protein [Solirubrobacterales bacterium]